MTGIRDVKSVIGVDPGGRKLITWALVNEAGVPVRVRQYQPPPEMGTYALAIIGHGDVDPDNEPRLYEAMKKATRHEYGIIAREIADCADRWNSLIVVDYNPPFPSGWWSLAEVFQSMAKRDLGQDISDLEDQKRNWARSVYPFLPLPFFIDDLTMRARLRSLPDPVATGAPYSSLTCGRCRTRDRTVREEAEFWCNRCGYEADADSNAAHNLGILGWELVAEQ